MEPESCQGWVRARRAQGGGWVLHKLLLRMQSCVISKNKDGLDSKSSPNHQAFFPEYWNTTVTLFHKYIKTYQAQFLQYISLISTELISLKGPSPNWQLGLIQVARNIQKKELIQNFKVKKKKKIKLYLKNQIKCFSYF